MYTRESRNQFSEDLWNIYNCLLENKLRAYFVEDKA